jgi:hypothetical protein
LRGFRGKEWNKHRSGMGRGGRRGGGLVRREVKESEVRWKYFGRGGEGRKEGNRRGYKGEWGVLK